MNAAQIKALGAEVWGAQGGLLSVAELDLLMALVRGGDCYGSEYRILEVGHYRGLSTCGIVHSLRESPENWRLHTVDAHVADQWVGRPAKPVDFDRNRLKYFDAPELSVAFDRSETLAAPLDYDVVFYDGDHADEQRRFTEQVIASPRVSLFVFDDRDFDVPRECCKLLRDAGWRDESPPLRRLKGDKTNAATMTLGVFRR